MKTFNINCRQCGKPITVRLEEGCEFLEKYLSMVICNGCADRRADRSWWRRINPPPNARNPHND